MSRWTPARAFRSSRLRVPCAKRGCACRGSRHWSPRRAQKPEISAACSPVAVAFVLSRTLLRFLERFEISEGHAADPSALPVLDLDELRRHAHRCHADDDVETSPVADDCSEFEHSRMRTPTRRTTSASATRPSAPIPRFGRPRGSIGLPAVTPHSRSATVASARAEECSSPLAIDRCRPSLGSAANGSRPPLGESAIIVPASFKRWTK